MATIPPNAPRSPDLTPLDHPANALEKVVEQEPIDSDLLLWAMEELLDGRDLQDLEQQLVEAGWAAATVEQIVETARQQTRKQRGVVTRDDVVRDLNVDYRRATGGLSVAFRSGLFGLYGFTNGFMSAWRTLRKLRRGVNPAQVRNPKVRNPNEGE
jgi:hypothetical protein